MLQEATMSLFFRYFIHIIHVTLHNLLLSQRQKEKKNAVSQGKHFSGQSIYKYYTSNPIVATWDICS